MVMNKVRCKQIVDNFKDDIQIEYEVDEENKTFRVTSLNPLGQRIINEELTAPHNNHRAISTNYNLCKDIYNSLISQYYGKFHNRIKENSKE